ncbi:MAG: DciA family protein [Anaeromyxobacteraceae bacterium]
MRGRGRPISSVLADTLRGRSDARPAALAAAFAEACGWPLAREVALRASTRDGRLIVVARTQPWADQIALLAPRIVERVNARLGRAAASGIDVRVGPVEK